VARDLEQVRRCDPKVRLRRALDFGCGAGRLTQALARHVERVTGVDISERMVALARQHCSDERVCFVQNVRPDLKVFACRSFDLVYSRITLQHIAPRYTRRYLREFIRVLGAGASCPSRSRTGSRPGTPGPPQVLVLAPDPVDADPPARPLPSPGLVSGNPKMQMYAIPKDQVLALLAALGAEVLSVEKCEHGAVDNYVYIARRPPGWEE